MTLAPLPPAQQTFVNRLGRAAADLTRARDVALAGLDAPVLDDTILHRAFGHAQRATGLLHTALAEAPTGGRQAATPTTLVERAIAQARDGLAELSRGFDDKPVASNVVRDAWNSAVHDIGTAQGLVKNPPPAPVYDGS